MHTRRIAPLLILALLTACGGPAVDRGYSGTARYRYQLGMEYFEDGDYLEAIKHFTFVKNKFAYSQYAALAELRVGDSYFEQEKFIEAIDAYRTFVQGRPNHREVPYAMYRIGDAHFQQRPSDFFIFPPAHEKDQSSTTDALRALRRYVDRFPEHALVKDARAQIRECRRALADHELYVARYYLGQDRPVSARGRLERIFADFEDTPSRWAEAAWMLVEVYSELDQREQAVKVARTLIAARPRSDEAENARDWLR